MSSHHNIILTAGATGENNKSVVGRKEPLAHPLNCRNECPYGYGRSFCFPCYAELMKEHREAMKNRNN